MGSPVIRQGTDISTGHDGYFPVVPVAGSGNVFVNGLPVVRSGDAYNPHSKKDHPPHTGIAVGGGTVFVNGKQAQRVGDSNTCGDHASNGSPNVRFG